MTLAVSNIVPTVSSQSEGVALKIKLVSTGLIMMWISNLYCDERIVQLKAGASSGRHTSRTLRVLSSLQAAHELARGAK
jgi:hypothetical protein